MIYWFNLSFWEERSYTQSTLQFFLFLWFSFFSTTHWSKACIPFLLITGFLFFWCLFIVVKSWLFKSLFFRVSSVKFVLFFFSTCLCCFFIFFKRRFDKIYTGIDIVIDGELVNFFIPILLFLFLISLDVVFLLL